MLAILFLAACAVLTIAYFTYGRFLERRLGVDDSRETPATTQRDGVDYVPTPEPVLFGHHFSSIAGAGPIVGPVVAGIAFGWGPAIVWILIGCIFVGGVHDFSALVASIRHRGQSIGQICRRYLNPVTYRGFLVFIWLAMVYVLAVFLDLTATSFAPVASLPQGESLPADVAASVLQGGNVATSSIIYIGLAVVFGLSVVRLKLPLWLGSLIFVPLVFVGLWAGGIVPLTVDRVPALFGSARNTWNVVLLGYCLVASVLPVWFLLQPRDYLSSFLLYACLLGGALGLVISGLQGATGLSYPVFRGFSEANLGFLFPALFITIACGAVSGFHSIVASGTTAKQLRRESAARPVAYGGMLVEGALGLLALSAVMILGSRPEGTPVAVFAGAIGTFVGSLGLAPEMAAAFGMLAVSTFLLTTLDTCTRLGRFIFVELFGLEGPAARFVGTLATLALPGVLVFISIAGPTGTPMPAWKAIWPAFGTTNQLLAALALLVVYTWLRHEGRRALFVLVPMVFMCVITLVSLVQLIAQHLLGEGSFLIGSLSLVMLLLALTLIVNTIASLRHLRPAVAEAGDEPSDTADGATPAC